MERTNFENLQIYNLSEKLSDHYGRLSFAGTCLREKLWASNWYERATASAQTLQKEAEEEPIQSFVVFCE